MFLPAKALEGLISMLTTAYYAYLFLPFAYGRFVSVNTTVLLCYLVFSGWLANAAARYAAEEKERDGGRSFFTTLFAAYSVVAAAALALTAAVWGLSGEPLYFGGAVMFLSYGLFQILNNVLIQTGRTKWSIFLSLSAASIKLCSAYLFLSLVTGGESSPYPAVFAAIVADLFAGVLAVFALKIPRLLSPSAFSRTLLSGFLSYGVPLLGVSIGVGLLNFVDRYLVLYYYNEDILATYSSNYSVSSGVFTLVMAAVMRGVYPSVIEAFREGGRDRAKPLLNQGARLYCLVAAPAAAGLIALSFHISHTLFVRPEYHELYFVIAVIAAAMFFMGLTEYSNKAWELEKTTVPILQNSLAAAAVKIISSAVMLPLVGTAGAAWGTLTAFIFYFAVSSLRARRVFLFSLGARRLFNILAACALCGFTARFAADFSGGRALGLLIAVFSGAVVYFIALALSGEISGELSALKKIVGRKIKGGSFK